MAALADILGMTDDNMRVLADASVMRIILMVNAIADGPYSTDSSKTYPFSTQECRNCTLVDHEQFDV